MYQKGYMNHKYALDVYFYALDWNLSMMSKNKIPPYQYHLNRSLALLTG